MRSFATKTLAILGMIFLLAFALAVSGWLKAYEPFSSGALAVLAGLGAFWLFRTRRGVVARTAASLCALFVMITGVNSLKHLHDATTEKQLAVIDDDQKRYQRNAESIARKLAADEENRKSQLERLRLLRTSDPDQYLQELKPLDLVKWVEELKLLRPKQFAIYQEEVRKENERAESGRQRANPKEYLTLNHAWRAGGFGSVMIADFTITSRLQFPVKDIAIRCTGYGNSGTKISELATTVYEIVPARATKRMSGVNVGFMSSQVTRAGCEINSVVPM